MSPRQAGRRLEQLRSLDGQPLLAHTQALIRHLLLDFDRIESRLKEIKAERRERVRQAAQAPLRATPVERATQLMQQFRGIDEGAGTIAAEFAWRDFRTPREVGAAAGLTGCLWQSGKTAREQGLARSGNRRARAVMVQIAWSWVRHQPRSALTRWWHKRFNHNKRDRKVGIIALARKLLIALWRLWTTGEVIEGAVLKPAAVA
jgi:transposase